MSIDDVYEQWERQVTQKGIEQGLAQEAKQILHMLYEARFGPMPDAIAATIEATHDTAKLESWMVLVVMRSPEEVAAAVQAGEP
jgi:hypothetical protein